MESKLRTLFKGHERSTYWKANINLLSSFLRATVFKALLGGTWRVGVFFCHIKTFPPY